MKVTYAYSIGSRVVIAETGHPGVITGLMTESAGSAYRIVWWNNGERKQEWLYEYELKGAE